MRNVKCLQSTMQNRVEYEQTLENITKNSENQIPKYYILLAGFSCQTFLIAGVSKENSLGREHGLADETQGTLFYDIVRILKAKRPRAFLHENVKKPEIIRQRRNV